MECLFINVECGKCFTIDEGFESADFVKIDPAKHEGMNAICIEGRGVTYEKPQHYYIQFDEVVNYNN